MWVSVIIISENILKKTKIHQNRYERFCYEIISSFIPELFEMKARLILKTGAHHLCEMFCMIFISNSNMKILFISTEYHVLCFYQIGGGENYAVFKI
ncbi:hypothetical protein Bhyg_10148 [Pseudolycoriella hygida]|uniref:Uncharacterized protein n=1 Tax=Pseudolycoriella hygida TaxID=35572 RepID=A0A9Q0MSZ1_9DIPT|nr:hypothetical protein Bhyg_10148 [Pseudolycoriella hygida]